MNEITTIRIYRQVESLSKELGFKLSPLEGRNKIWSLKHDDYVYSEGLFYSLRECLSYLYGIQEAEAIYRCRK